MVNPPATTVDATEFAAAGKKAAQPRVGRMAHGLIGSEILKIAAEIRALQRAGRSICNLTVGDFDPAQFPIPTRLREAIVAAYGRGETNYPPSDGVLALREAVQRFYRRELGIDYPLGSVLIASGARPIIHAAYAAVCDPGDKVVYPVPSWNNNHYTHMVGAEPVPIPCAPTTRFLPTRAQIEAALPGARLVCINSPLNPTGTAIDPEELRGICKSIVAENEARERRGERPAFLLYDQIYFMLRVGDTVHATPPALVPEMARYTIFVDGISKAFASTGVRVGWGVGPVDVIERMSAIVGHVGAWAPRAEQIATAELLDDTTAIGEYILPFRAGIQERLVRLHDGLEEMGRSGLPVEALPPMGAIYLTARIAPFGRRTPDGIALQTNEDIRRYLLEAAGVGVVPFQAFGCSGEDGWFRLSIGAVGLAEIDAALPRLAHALRQLR
ncbi:MAG TPA: aminotransferase class I/II-fold pyridoxal phosphate-dependent enzyme [Planctomycetota bacterium]|nr:aminotransferase class I/II-fold pyridoxal phosphate-dependent enzyme [Planctomycetota bacterium]